MVSGLFGLKNYLDLPDLRMMGIKTGRIDQFCVVNIRKLHFLRAWSVNSQLL
jgi:hypothetical protein